MTFVVTPGQWVIAMEADFATESVIWLNVADSSSPTVERITIDGSERVTILASPRLKTFSDLALYNVNSIIWFVSILTSEQSASFLSLKAALFSLGLSHWKRF